MRRPGRVALRLSALTAMLGLVALGLGSVLLARSAYADVDDFARVALDGSPHVVRLDRTGDYVGYYERPRLDTGRPAPAPRVSITGADGPVNVRRYDRTDTVTYDLYGHHGIAVVTFTIGAGGRYTVTGTASGADLALGGTLGHNVAVGVVLAAGGVVLVIIAVVLLVVGLTRRRADRQRPGRRA